jgi:hypothetical protein
MNVIENENTVFYDVDDTLVMHNVPYDDHDIVIVNPYDNGPNYLGIHQKHISLLKQHKGRGKFIVVWSAAGAKWAETVVKALGIESFVDLIITKPSAYVDDLTGNEILGTRIYLK